ncbi:MAG TPA: SDR family oxidoreductase [Anaerolineae bacterium]|nr:SDR family oxidoreductase [Anaerolineae bacterium]
MRMKQKVSIITGAQSGIGLATARRFAAEGATVVLADIKDASPAANELVGTGAQAHFVQTDVSNASQVEALLEQTLSAYGHLDVLVNNAGVELPKRITDTTEAEWDRLMDVNLKGVFLCSRAAIPAMQRQGGGVIVNVGSELGVVGGSEIAAYCATKGGVVQLTKAMAVDHAADGIRVNCVCPGPVATPLLEATIHGSSDPEKERLRILDKTLMKRFGHPKEIASAILFLASDESSYMTGSILLVDGGVTAH